MVRSIFDKNNTSSMRGFWCLIVVLVHIPMSDQNCIQYLIDSFAYIGVTFFFMTSAYGLKIAVSRVLESIKYFWHRRLPKILIPCILVNITDALITILKGNPVVINNLLYTNDWVQWLLICYLTFWAVTRFIWRNVLFRTKDRFAAVMKQRCVAFCLVVACWVLVICSSKQYLFSVITF